MPVSLCTHVDPIEELMFRCWARRNYLPFELREADWHPVILEEMALRDRELEEESRSLEMYHISPSRNYVPLVPTVTHYVHPGQGEIREPHFLSMANTSDGLYTDAIYAGGIYDFAY